jgi:hypothetical protein
MDSIYVYNLLSEVISMMLNINKKLMNIIIIFVGVLFIGCTSALSFSSADNPESDDLLRQLNGYIIIDKPKGGIVAIELPSNKEIIIRQPWGISNPVKALGGLDKQGRIAFIDSDLGSKTYSLKIINISTKKETEVFTRPGSYWPHEKQNYGKSFSFSDTGGLAAFVKNYKDDSSLIPNDYVSIGDLEIVNTEKRSTVKTDINILDMGIDWFPDGEKLVYVALMPKDKINKDLTTKFADGFGSEMMTWHSTPVIVLLNLADMSTKQLHIGWNPIVSKDGSLILIQDYKGRIRLYDVSSGDSIPVNVPIGEECRVFSLIGKDFLLYKTIPATGRKHRLTSTFGITPYWTLRVAQMNTTKYKTVIQHLDEHRIVSYGEVQK